MLTDQERALVDDWRKDGQADGYLPRVILELIAIIDRLKTGAMVGEREALEKWYYSFLYSSASNKPFADALLASGIIARVPTREEIVAVFAENTSDQCCYGWTLLADAVLGLLKPKAQLQITKTRID